MPELLPYAFNKQLGYDDTGRMVQHTQCPECGVWVTETERKDFESFLNTEYAKHYEQEHRA